jgi:hypothetical protein
MTKQEIAAKIAAAEHELNVREIAAGNLSGIPARQNAAAISTLYDRLNHLHIERIECAA